MSKIIYSGLESSGKSLKLAMVVCDLVHRNKKIFEKFGLRRPIWSNLEFSPEFREYCEQNNVPLMIWKNLNDLILISEADVVIDEVGNYFDSRMWQDLSLDVRRWLTQGAKCGIEIYGSAQDFAQVDKSFRRLCDTLYEIKKLIGSPRPSSTRPPVKRIWGICMMRQLNPVAYNEDKKKFENGAIIPSFFTIQKRYCEIFDTKQKIVRSLPAPLIHEERSCPTCGLKKCFHV